MLYNFVLLLHCEWKMATKYLFIAIQATNLVIDVSSRYLNDPEQRNIMLNRMRTKVQLRVSPVSFGTEVTCCL